MRSLLWYPVPRTASVTHRSLLNICWLNNYAPVVMRLGCVLSICLPGEAFYCPWQYYWTKSLGDQENLLSAWMSREEVVFGGKGMDLITTPSNLFYLFLMAAVISAADQSCLLLILFYLGFHYIHYLWLCLLCRFLFILLSQFMGDTHDWVLRSSLSVRVLL